MNPTADELTEQYGIQCMHCKRGTLVPYESDCICIVCCYNVKKMII